MLLVHELTHVLQQASGNAHSGEDVVLQRKPNLTEKGIRQAREIIDDLGDDYPVNDRELKLVTEFIREDEFDDEDEKDLWRALYVAKKRKRLSPDQIRRFEADLKTRDWDEEDEPVVLYEMCCDCEPDPDGDWMYTERELYEDGTCPIALDENEQPLECLEGLPPGTGIDLPAPVIIGGLAIIGAGLLGAGLLVRRRTVRVA